jgi:heterodisulfide reductase subunit C
MIKSNQLDPNFKSEISKEPGGEHLKRCFSCGTCTAGCPVREITEKYNPRKIIRMAILGLRDEVLSSDFIWLCSSCYSCYERCPQDVRIPELMNAMKNIAVREGYLPRAYRTQVDLLWDHGRLLEISDFENEERQEHGLPPIHEKVEGVRRILKVSGVDKLRGSREITPEE